MALQTATGTMTDRELANIWQRQYPTIRQGFSDRFNTTMNVDGQRVYPQAAQTADAYGPFDPMSPTWFMHPEAASWMQRAAANPNEFSQWNQGSNRFAVPEGFRDVYSNPLDFFNQAYLSRDKETRDAWFIEQMLGHAAEETARTDRESGASALRSAAETAAGEITGAADTLGQSWQAHLGRFEAARTAGIGELQAGIIDYRNQPAHQRLTEWNQPGYQAMSDEFVSGQKAAAARDIGKGQANAIASAVAQADRTGRGASGFGPQMQAAAGFRGAGERAQIGAGLESLQQTFNTDFQLRAAAELGDRDKVVSRLQEIIAEYKSATPGVDPYAGTAAGMASQAAQMRFGGETAAQSLLQDRPESYAAPTEIPSAATMDRVLSSEAESQAFVGEYLQWAMDHADEGQRLELEQAATSNIINAAETVSEIIKGFFLGWSR